MPSGDPKEHDYWTKLGPGKSGDFNAIWYLEQRGWRQTRQFFWVTPHAAYDVSKEEWRAVDYLIAEWDFGGLAIDNGAPEQPLAPKLTMPISDEGQEAYDAAVHRFGPLVQAFAVALAILLMFALLWVFGYFSHPVPAPLLRERSVG